MLKTEHKIGIVVGLLLVGGAVVFTVDQARKSPRKVSEVAQFDGPGVSGTPAPKPPPASPGGAAAPRDAANRLDRPAPVRPDTGSAPPPVPPPSGAGAATRPAAGNMPPLDLAAVLREKTGLTGNRVQTPAPPPPGPEATLPAAGGSVPAPGDSGANRPPAPSGSTDRPASPSGGTPPSGPDTGSRPDTAPPKSAPPKPTPPTGGTPPSDGGALPAARKHVVEEGDSLWALAEQYYGDGKYYVKIAAANKLTNPDVLTAGTELVIPPKDEPTPRPGTERPRSEPKAGDARAAAPDTGKASGEVLKPAAGSRPGADAASPDTTTKPPPKDVSAKAPAGAKPAETRGAANNGANGSKTPAKEKTSDAKGKSAAAANGKDKNGAAATRADSAPADKDKPAAAGKTKPRRTHIVAKGETLRTIARTELKNEDLWRKIYELNKSRIKNPNVLPVGLVLVLPEP